MCDIFQQDFALCYKKKSNNTWICINGFESKLDATKYNKDGMMIVSANKYLPNFIKTMCYRQTIKRSTHSNLKVNLKNQ